MATTRGKWTRKLCCCDISYHSKGDEALQRGWWRQSSEDVYPVRTTAWKTNGTIESSAVNSRGKKILWSEAALNQHTYVVYFAKNIIEQGQARWALSRQSDRKSGPSRFAMQCVMEYQHKTHSVGCFRIYHHYYKSGLPHGWRLESRSSGSRVYFAPWLLSTHRRLWAIKHQFPAKDYLC